VRRRICRSTCHAGLCSCSTCVCRTATTTSRSAVRTESGPEFGVPTRVWASHHLSHSTRRVTLTHRFFAIGKEVDLREVISVIVLLLMLKIVVTS